MEPKKKGMTLVAKQKAAGWAFLIPASAMIAIMSFFPMVKAFILSLQTGKGANMHLSGFSNYVRMFQDKVFLRSVGNTFIYLAIQVPIMLVLAILLAQLLNNRDLKLRGFFRTCVFLPCATSLVSYALIFRFLFAQDGFVNNVLVGLGILDQGYNFLGNAISAKIVIIIALVWRWTGYNMVFYLAGLQNIEYSVYEAAKIDGANGWVKFWKISLPSLNDTMVYVVIMTIIAGFQVIAYCDVLTNGAPFNTTLVSIKYIWKQAFEFNNMGYASTLSLILFPALMVVTYFQVRGSDKRGDN